jgi:outer membrane protein assembly factor BamB
MNISEPMTPPRIEPLIIGSNGYVASIDPATGQENWRTGLPLGMMGGTSSCDVSVLVSDGRVLAGASGHLFGLDVEDGRILWQNDLKGMGFNDVSMAMEHISIQYLQKVVRSSSPGTTT